jgi:hypothetical protein
VPLSPTHTTNEGVEDSLDLAEGTGLPDLSYAEFESRTIHTETKKNDVTLFSSRLPTLEDLICTDITPDKPHPLSTISVPTAVKYAEPWTITDNHYEAISAEVQSFSAILPNGCTLPSQHVLIRYLEKYMRCVQEYLPFIHIPTLRIESRPAELVLAMAVLGAQYSFDRVQAYKLYFMIRAIVAEKKQRTLRQHATSFLVGSLHSTRDDSTLLGQLQTNVLLLSFAGWADHIVREDALGIASDLALLTSQLGILDDENSGDAPVEEEWLSWTTAEEARRSVFAAYVQCSMLSIISGNFPQIEYNKLSLRLPSFAAVWKATSEREWRSVCKASTLSLSRGIKELFTDNTPDSGTPRLSSFGLYILIHNVLQDISSRKPWNCADTMLDQKSQQMYERALSRCQKCWDSIQETAQDSGLDPLYAKGPLAMTGGALLRLAYIRLSCGRNLSQDFVLDYQSHNVDMNPAVQSVSGVHIDRSATTHAAVLQCAHSLSVPARLGISFMTTTKTAVWSIEQSICWLESAVFLQQWLLHLSDCIQDNGNEALNAMEERLLAIVEDIIQSTVFANALEGLEDRSSRLSTMAYTAVKIFATIFQGVNVLDIENVIGGSLQRLSSVNLP